MNKTTTLMLIATACISFLLGQTITTKAEGKSFSGIIPFSTPTGLLGLFNQNDGKVYIYDNNVKECLFEGQIEELGKKATTIRADQPQSVESYKRPTTK